ncbi:ABC transporter substrate-binding protein [Roseibium denhamense]|uniref:Peptide/nickel transport system substrate-binding protein n=1 Tax=Roseibium denhamense TaxID=76305 RepID=A0ABY1N8C1_9HYPH|nr:ABC transporter substrate-binding protein [Roseibium denhamense]MTI06111.1 ABC transporter substrate-binding protein [Roseibium denhamense]SMP01109.1 peptide/nickel transport system substrate-binding protein [Roseibium denhamense]
MKQPSPLAARRIASLTLAAAMLSSVSIASAAELRWSSPTDPQTMDPHAVNSAPVLGFLNNVYEGLVRRDKDMQIEGSLAESWEPLGNEGWRFNLRQGVKFHDGADFTAEDVLFSYQRASSEAADTASWFAPIKDVQVVDDYTIDFLTHAPDPIFPDSIANFMILDKGWAEANGAVTPAKETETFATLNTNGTGPFKVVAREPGVQTVLEPFDGWWDEAGHNLTKATFLPIANPATAVAGLLSGQVDLIDPVPVQDVDRISRQDGLTLHQGIEARVIMLGFGHSHETLKYSDDATGKNPFQDVRVREAVQKAINADAMVDKIMRGKGEVASQLVSAQMKGYSNAASERIGYDPDGAKALLEEAGYPDGFSFGLQCPNDRYINDEALCKAMAAMLTQVGMKAELNAMPVRSYWPELREGNFDMYLLGWSPGTFDAEHPIRFLVTSQNDEKKLGSWNFGGYSNARVDELLPLIQREIDPEKRQAMLDEVALIVRDDVVYVPLHIQPLLWGSKSNIDLTQRADNFLMLRWITVN